MKTLFGPMALLLAAVAGAGPLADRLPAGASMVAEADFAILRAAKVVDRASWDASAGPAVLERAGVKFRRDVDRIAVAVLPSIGEGKPRDVVALMAGRFDAAAIKKGLAGQGARSVKLGAVPAWRMPGGATFELHPSLPGIDVDGDEIFVSFLGDLLVVGSDRGTKAAHGPKEGVPSPALAAARASVPASAPAWVAVDMAAQGAGALPLQGLKSLTAWAFVGDAIDLRALAQAGDSKQATQLAGLVSILAGAASSSPEGRLLKGLDVRATGPTVQAALMLSADQVRSLSAEAAKPKPKP